MDDDEIPYFDIDHYEDLGDHSWKAGRPFGNTIGGPITFSFEMSDEYDGPPPELEDTGVPIMSAEMANTLVGLGVDNIEYFDVKLSCADKGLEYDYKAYNIVGLVAAADLDNSVWSSYDGKALIDTSFMSVALDDKRTHTLPLFRLAENVNAIIVHEKVKSALESAGFDMLTFTRPEDWTQL